MEAFNIFKKSIALKTKTGWLNLFVSQISDDSLNSIFK